MSKLNFNVLILWSNIFHEKFKDAKILSLVKFEFVQEPETFLKIPEEY